MPIQFFNEEVELKLIHAKDAKKWLDEVIAEEIHKAGAVNIIFCNDEYLLKLNKQFLSHDYYTDVITFNNSNKKILAGDIFISIERVKENAEIYKCSFFEELYRVMVHGVLHLLDYDDATPELKLKMTEKENYYLLKMNNPIKNLKK